MATHGIADLALDTLGNLTAIAASTVVVAASVGKLPLILRIALGCIIFGLLVGG